MTNFEQIIKEKCKQHAYVDGAKAGYNKLKLKDNPFVKDTKEYEEWVDGFIDYSFLFKMTGGLVETVTSK